MNGQHTTSEAAGFTRFCPSPGQAGAQVLQVDGPLTFDQLESLQDSLREMWLTGANRLIINLTACPYVDSSGLALLASAARRAHRLDRGFVLVGVSPQVRNVLRLTRLDQVFEIRASLEDALLT